MLFKPLLLLFISIFPCKINPNQEFPNRAALRIQCDNATIFIVLDHTVLAQYLSNNY